MNAEVDGVPDREQEQHADQAALGSSQPMLDGLKRLLSWRGPIPAMPDASALIADFADPALHNGA